MILDKIREMIAEQFMVELEDITAETAFVSDLGADSLDVVELIMALEDEFGLSDTPEEALAEIITVGDLADYVARTVG